MEADRKRKLAAAEEAESSSMRFCMDELNQDLVEQILCWLPTSAFFRLSSVCKRWKTAATSRSFRLACSTVPHRDPWFFMVDPCLNQTIIFDSTERAWKNLNHLPLLSQYPNLNSIPVAASGGLLCFRNVSGHFIICNPLTRSCRQLPSPNLVSLENQSLHAIAMTKNDGRNYKLLLVFGELPRLYFKAYNSSVDHWEEDVKLNRELVDNLLESDSNDSNAVYFLSKAGDLVATNMQRSPSKQYSSVITCKNGGDEIVYFISSSGTVVACNLKRGCFSEYPRLLPAFYEYSIDLVECGGEMLAVVLSEFLESASLRVWRFDEDIWCWHQIAAMPPAMSHEFYRKKVDINCVGAGNLIMICMNSAEYFSYVLCDLLANEWVELPKCFINGQSVEFMSAFAFEPRIEACV